MDMEYETIQTEYVDYGRNKFLEIAKKKVLPDGTVFLNISKGYYTPEGEKRYQRGIGFPDDPKLVSDLTEKLSILAAGESTPTEETQAESVGSEETPEEGEGEQF